MEKKKKYIQNNKFANKDELNYLQLNVSSEFNYLKKKYLCLNSLNC